MATRGISSFVIPVCQNIPSNTVVVSEKVDGCGTYTSVPFTISPNDPNYGPAPTGFSWLKVESNNRFDKGVTNVPFSVDTNYVVSITCSNPCKISGFSDLSQGYTLSRPADNSSIQSSSSDCGCGGGLASSNPARRYTWQSDL